jgi:hypothetical protein
MKQFFSDFFNIPEKTIESYGAYNVSLVSDLPLFIDPFLIFNSVKPEYLKLHEEIIKYLNFLRNKSLAGKLNDGLIADWFTFPEVKQNWFGYSKTGNRGSGLGLKFATSLNQNFRTLTDFGQETISHSHLEKLTLINDGVGRDNISDFTTNLIKKFLCTYTQKFARQYLPDRLRQTHVIDKVKFNYNTESWIHQSFELPNYDSSIPDNYVILTPVDILSKDEAWISRPDLLKRFQVIANSIPNFALRSKLNNYFNKRLSEIVPPTIQGRSKSGRKQKPKKPTQKQKAQAASDTIREYPIILDFFLKEREGRGKEAETVSSLKVVESKLLYLKQFAKLGALLLDSTSFYSTDDVSYKGSVERLKILKDAVETKGGNEIFHYNGRPIEDEDNLSILFRLTWKAQRSTNAGNPAEVITTWKPSRKNIKIVLKLCSNPQLKATLEKLRDVYDERSNEQKYILALVYYSTEMLNSAEKLLKQMGMENHKNMVLINGEKSDFSSDDDMKEKAPSKLFTDGYGLIIGVGGNIPITVDDAVGLHAILTNPDRAAYPAGQVKLLTETAANRNSILQAFDELAAQVKKKPNATVMIYYSGHGGEVMSAGKPSQYFLVPNDYDPSDFANTAITGEEFIKKIRAIKAKKIIIILDCCHAGGIPVPKAFRGRGYQITKSSVPPNLPDILSAGSGQVMIASSRNDESSYTGTPYSVFTNCFIEALSGKATRTGDGFARILDVIGYILDEVPKRAPGGKQHPNIPQINGLSENFPICFYDGGRKNAEITTSTKPSVALTPTMRERQELMRSGLQSTWKLQNEKANKIREALAIETDVTTIYKYEQQLMNALAECDKTAAEIDELDRLLND